MTLDRSARISALAAWGEALAAWPDRAEVLRRAQSANAWFTPEEGAAALNAIVERYLDTGALEAWLAPYPEPAEEGRSVGIVAAGNVPLVGFHDLLCALAAGHVPQVKLSSKDDVLLPWTVEVLAEVEPLLGARVTFPDKLTGFDAVIATGGSNTSRYFHRYFGRWPHIIRGRRHAAAVLEGDETGDELRGLAEDVFRFYGLGCRSVSKLHLPANYDPARLLEAFECRRDVLAHTRYKNNFDYHRAVLLLNGTGHLASDSLLLVERPEPASPLATLHYERYRGEGELQGQLESEKDRLQIVVGRGAGRVPFGEAQRPGLADYADGVDTMDFLLRLPQPA